MDAGDLAAVVVALSAVIAVVGLLFTLASITRAMAVFSRSVDEVTRQTLPLIADTHAAIRQAHTDLDKADRILDNAHSISATVDSASRLAYFAFANPLVKLLALGSGAGRAVARLRARRAGLVTPATAVRTDRRPLPAHHRPRALKR